MILLYHGQMWPLGTKSHHEDATDETYENETTYTVAVNDKDGTYSIQTDIVNTIPQSVIKGALGGLAGMFSDNDTTDDLKEEMNKGIDSAITTDGFIDSYFEIDYLPMGWPSDIVKVKTTMIGNRGKAEQTLIHLEDFSIGLWRD